MRRAVGAGLFFILTAFHNLVQADCEQHPTRLVEFEIRDCTFVEKDLLGGDLTKWQTGLLLNVHVKAEYVLATGDGDQSIDSSHIERLDVPDARTYFFQTTNPILCNVRFTARSRHVMHQIERCCDVVPPRQPICAAQSGFHIEPLPF